MGGMTKRDINDFIPTVVKYAMHVAKKYNHLPRMTATSSFTNYHVLNCLKETDPDSYRLVRRVLSAGEYPFNSGAVLSIVAPFVIKDVLDMYHFVTSTRDKYTLYEYVCWQCMDTRQVDGIYQRIRDEFLQVMPLVGIAEEDDDVRERRWPEEE